MKLQPSGLNKPSPRTWWLALSCLLGTWTLGLGAPAPGGRHDLPVRVVAQFNGRPLAFDAMSLTNRAGQVLSVTRLDFLLSDVAVHRSDGTWLENTSCQAFVSLREGRSAFEVKGLPGGQYDRIRFHIGLTPALNHTDPARYPAAHPLNANLNGLHWSWAGGYIFLALEGGWRDAAGKQSGYSFHLGNDPLLMTVDLPVTFQNDSTTALALNLGVDRLFDTSLGENDSSTRARAGDTRAVELARSVESAFSVSALHWDQSTESIQAASASPAMAAVQGTPWPFTFSARFPKPDLPRDNPLTQEGVELGRRLFFENMLSLNNAQSCASCHQAGAAFADSGRRFSVGAEGNAGSRNAMPLFNLAWKSSFFWDGRAATLREQVLMPIQNPVEMHDSLTNAVAKLGRTTEYPAQFAAVFGSPEISSDRMAKALEQFLLAQVSFDSKFDRALDGRATLTEQEKRGLELFFTEYDPRRGQFGADCFHCHGGPFFTTHGFANNGLDRAFNDAGRFLVTKNGADRGRFAVPSLRNVAVTAPYMHDGRFATLEEVIGHYSTGVKRSANLDPNLAKHPDGGVPLKSDDKAALVAFLKTLTESKLQVREQNSSQPRLTSRR